MKMTKVSFSLLALTVVLALLLVACGDGDRGLSRAEVEDIVREELANTPVPAEPEPELAATDVEEAIRAAMAEMPLSQTGLSTEEVERIVETEIAAIPTPQPGLTSAQVEDAIRTALAGMAQPGPGLTSTEAERIARGVVASIPPKSSPAEYTAFVVDGAIARYQTQGREATLAHYSRKESIDGQWYVFIIDEDDRIAAHPDRQRVGLDVTGWVGTDINGYRFGPEMLAATEAGRWVPYVYVNPAGDTLGDEGAFELKNAWVVRHDGLLFASGWYIDNEEFAPQLISESAEHFRRGGLEAILEFSNDPQGISAGLIPTVEYYNSTDTLDGYFSGFVAAPDGEILSHFDPALIGTDIEDLLGPAVRNATPDGAWITAEDNPAGAAGPQTMRIWVIDVDGTLIGGGWYNDGTG